MKHFVAIAGNIGVGKSTLAAMLSQTLGWEPVFEAVGENPYLSDFYSDMERWSFHSQVFFVSRRLLHHRQLVDHPGSVIQDRSVYEDAEVFARNLYEQGNMNERDYQCYRGLYEALLLFLPVPDLVVYLRASVPTLQARIARRGRLFERSISEAYLARLNCLYDEWIAHFTLSPVLTIQSDDLDFVAYQSHLDLIRARILDRLQGQEQLIIPPSASSSP